MLTDGIKRYTDENKVMDIAELVDSCLINK
jgi:hypothetical protein